MNQSGIRYSEELRSNIIAGLRRLFTTYHLGDAFILNSTVHVEKEFLDRVVTVNIRIPLLLFALDVSFAEDVFNSSYEIATVPHIISESLISIEQEIITYITDPLSYFIKRYEEYLENDNVFEDIKIDLPLIRKVRE